ncbi:MAG: hypothetical protein FJW96_02310 [Actinobacteria bacterium]|nr:hypothetical protein [Actinomycetota bacterium]
MTETRPLLAVDGDSFAHRAYHALPSSMRRAGGGPANAITGFLSMLLRLWEAERPRCVVVGWDSIGSPTYRNELLPGYQGGRVFDPEILEQLDLLPGLVAASGIVCGKAAGYEADDFLAAAVAFERRRGGMALVATSDRDSFQLAGPDVTILQPTRGVSEITRVDGDGVVSRYGVRPDQVVDFIALRGDPSDRIPGARGVGEKTAAALLREHGTLDAVLAAGRFPTQAEELRLYRRIAQLDETAPVPDLPDREPDWAAAGEAVSALGLDRLARRLADASPGSA